MRVLVVGTGTTGRLVINQLLNQSVGVNAIVHSIDTLPDHPSLTKIPVPVTDITSDQMTVYLKGCDVVISCLGHSPTFNGVFGSPRFLVTDALTKICEAITFNADQQTGENAAVKLIMLNSSNYSNPDMAEALPLIERFILSILRFLSASHLDNQTAADFLRARIGQYEKSIEWVVVRPSPLRNEKQISKYSVHASPVRNLMMNINSVSRINVADFIAELVMSTNTWQTWKGKMPVLYNQLQ